jgi:hypothetical protein
MNKLFIPFLFLFFHSCNRGGNVDTPKEFVNNVTVNPSLYSKDSNSILIDLYNKMENHTASFQNPEYFDSTRLYLDTVIYDNTFNKIALFVISEIPVDRNPYSESNRPYYYNANCYLGKRIFADSSHFELKNIGPVSIINFDDRTTTSKAIRKSYYSELTTFLDGDGIPNYEYNVNDKRFWESLKGWKRVFP